MQPFFSSELTKQILLHFSLKLYNVFDISYNYLDRMYTCLCIYRRFLKYTRTRVCFLCSPQKQWNKIFFEVKETSWRLILELSRATSNLRSNNFHDYVNWLIIYNSGESLQSAQLYGCLNLIICDSHNDSLSHSLLEFG